MTGEVSDLLGFALPAASVNSRRLKDVQNIKEGLIFIDTYAKGLDSEIKRVDGRLDDIERISKYNLAGDIVVNTGKLRWYPEKNITITSIYTSVGKAGAQDTILSVKKNGVEIPGISLVILKNVYKTNKVLTDIDLTTNDYITIDVMSAGGSGDGIVYFTYK